MVEWWVVEKAGPGPRLVCQYTDKLAGESFYHLSKHQGEAPTQGFPQLAGCVRLVQASMYHTTPMPATSATA